MYSREWGIVGGGWGGWRLEVSSLGSGAMDT